MKIRVCLIGLLAVLACQKEVQPQVQKSSEAPSSSALSSSSLFSSSGHSSTAVKESYLDCTERVQNEKSFEQTTAKQGANDQADLVQDLLLDSCGYQYSPERPNLSVDHCDALEENYQDRNCEIFALDHATRLMVSTVDPSLWGFEDYQKHCQAQDLSSEEFRKKYCGKVQ